MANEFYVQVVDLAGNALASKQFYVYPTKAAAQADIASNNGSGKQTTVESQPLSTDASGECVFNIADANIETVYMRVKSESYVEGVRTVTSPSIYSYSTDNTPTMNENWIKHYSQTDNANYKIEVGSLLEGCFAIGAVEYAGSYPMPKRLFLYVAPTSPEDGDIVFMLES